MEESTFYLEASDGKKIFIRKWDPSLNHTSLAVVQIVHGMAEHSARYKNLASALNEQGIIVYANDHRGHGKTENTPKNRGHFADQHGWELAVLDQYLITDHIKRSHPDVPIIVLGHSLGSIIVRRYIQWFGDEIKGAILSGTVGKPGIQERLGLMLVNVFVHTRGVRYRSSFIHKLIFGKYNLLFKPNRTAYDWLTRDEDEVDKYAADEWCGYISTVGLTRDMLLGMVELHKPKNVKEIPKELPILIFSGEKDPLSNAGKTIHQTVEHYKKMGIANIKYNVYKEGRHEMLNEINKEEVYQDINEWIKSLSKQ